MTLAALSALVFSGCVVFDPASPPTAAQQGTIGAVRVTVTACASHSSSPPPGSCSSQGNSGSNAPAPGLVQLFLAFRVPVGSSPPPSFTSTRTGPSNTGPQLNFTPNASYTRELQRLAPAPAREQWFGFVSQPVSYGGSSGEQNFTASADFGLPIQANGSPFTGPFTYQAVVGGRRLSGATATDPVECPGAFPGAGETPSGGDAWVCADDQFPSPIGSHSSVTTRDLGVEPGAPLRALPGTVVSVPFTAAYSGSTSGGTFTFSPGTTLPGSTITPSALTFSPSSSSSLPVSVKVKIPKNAKPGNYNVSLTARSSSGETRTGTTELTILPQCHVPKLKGRTLKQARKRLKQAHCRLGKVRRRHATARKSKIIAQKPKPGKKLKSGAKVSITVSLGL